jgi:hypothetical protein
MSYSYMQSVYCIGGIGATGLPNNLKIQLRHTAFFLMLGLCPGQPDKEWQRPVIGIEMART